MIDTTNLVLALAAILAAGALLYPLGPSFRRLDLKREAERFRLNPRIGDKAGYLVTSMHAVGSNRYRNIWAVGTVTKVRSLNEEGSDGPYVELETVYSTATGTTTKRAVWSVAVLRHFPPTTEVGFLETNE